jgi:hypothetical protein
MFLAMRELDQLACDIADAILYVDRCGTSYKAFRPGAGPYGEPDLVKLIASYLSSMGYYDGAVTKKSVDLLIPGQWAIEFKIARPFGDNGRIAENWSVNLLHPYPGNTSTLGDCLKLANSEFEERKAVVVIGFEHYPAQIPLWPLLDSFEVIAKQILQINLSARCEQTRNNLIHPVHQC